MGLFRLEELHGQVITQAREMFSLLRERNSRNVLRAIMLWCRARISTGLKNCITRNRPMLDALSSYRLGPEDRDTFHTLYPHGIPIRSSIIYDLGKVIAKWNTLEPQSVITADHLEMWLHRIGNLPSVLGFALETLGSTPKEDPDFEKRCNIAIDLYTNLLGAAKFLKGSIAHFFPSSVTFRKGLLSALSIRNNQVDYFLQCPRSTTLFRKMTWKT